MAIASSLSLSITLPLLCPGAIAQVTPDGTLSTTVTSSDALNFTINNGTRSGTNLFHSFSDFSVPTNGSAIFNNAAEVSNILSRVTESNISNIDGLIQSNGTANVFILNPNGIIFGQDVSLNIGGSFLATTAESFIFDDGVIFSAENLQTPSLLSMTAPIGLQFGPNPGAIQVSGPGHQLSLDFSTLSLIRDNRPEGLQVPDRQTLGLVGGDILLEGGNLTAEGGRVELGSVTDEGTVSLRALANGFTFDYGEISAFGDITLSQAASVEVSSNGGGNVHLQGGQISLLEDSIVIADIQGRGNGGNITIRASHSIDILGRQPPLFPTGLFSRVESGATGNGGRMIVEAPTVTIGDTGLIFNITFGSGDSGALTIEADNLFIQDGAQITTGTAGKGDGGTLTVRATETIDIRRFFPNGFLSIPSGLFSSTRSSTDGVGGGDQDTGRGGDIWIETDQLRVEEGSRISARTATAGNAGDITILARDIIISDPFFELGGIGVLVQAEASGNGGNLTIEADRLRVRRGGQISSSTFGAGRAGTITLTVDDITVDGSGTFLEESLDGTSQTVTTQSQIAALAETDFNAGAIQITTENLTVSNGGTINVNSLVADDAGNLTIDADSIFLSDGGVLQAEVTQGTQGNIFLAVDTLLLMDQESLISANATGTATGGNVDITAPLVVGANNSDIVANAIAGPGGQVRIDALSVLGLEVRDRLTVDNDITASSELGVAFDGTVDVTNPEADPASDTIELPSGLSDESDRITTGCFVALDNSFTVIGRGGLPDNPTTVGNAPVWEDWRSLETERDSAPNEQSTTRPSATPQALPIEATGLMIHPNGRVEFVASTPSIPRQASEGSCLSR